MKKLILKINGLSYSSLLKDDETLSPKIEQYEEVLSVLSDKSWRLIELKTIESFKQNIKRRGKQPFFNHLNEALAYKFLKDCGFEKIEFIEETNKEKSPDIEFYDDGIKYYCEVKTIGESEHQFDIYEKEGQDNGDSYEKLGKLFFYKLGSTLYNAIEQMPTSSSKNIVFVVIHFDDLAVIYRNKYKAQIQDFLEKYYPDISVHIRANIFEQISLNHGLLPNKANSADAKKPHR